MASEETIAGASYILSLYNDLESVTNAYSAYLNVLVRIKDKYHPPVGDKTKEEMNKQQQKLDEDDEEALLTTAETLRVWITRCYIKSVSLSDKIPELKKALAELKGFYEKAISTSVIDKETAEGFVISINKTFVSGILKDLLIQSKDIYTQLLKP